MSSAAILAEQAAVLQSGEAETPAKGAPPSLPSGRVETPGAIYDNGKVYLKGNPLRTTREILCPRCKLPRLLHPTSGLGARQPEPGKQYCASHPFITKPGHDIYGNAFPTDAPKKKERELLKAQQVVKDDTPNSQDGVEGTEANGAVKKGVHYPWHTCPNCKRSLLITRFAQHLEKCLGIAGRQSSRNAMAKLSSQNGNTPLGSRMGTPQPGTGLQGGKSGTGKRKGQCDSDEDEETPKAKKKKLAKTKTKNEEYEDEDEVGRFKKAAKPKNGRPPKGSMGMSALGKAAKAQAEKRATKPLILRTDESRKSEPDDLVKIRRQSSGLTVDGAKDEGDGVVGDGDADADAVADEGDT